MEPWFCDPFEVLEWIGIVAYRMVFSPLIKVHDVLNVSFLKIYVQYFNHLNDWSML